MVERALICPPHSQIGPITPEQRQQLMANSIVAGVYDTAVDRESAYELLKNRASHPSTTTPGQPLAPGQTPQGHPPTLVLQLALSGLAGFGRKWEPAWRYPRHGHGEKRRSHHRKQRRTSDCSRGSRFPTRRQQQALIRICEHQVRRLRAPSVRVADTTTRTALSLRYSITSYAISLRCSPHGVAVDGDRIFNVIRVASGKRRHDRNSTCLGHPE